MSSPKVLADDAMVTAKGSRVIKRLARTLHSTHVYLHNMGANVAPAKCFNFATTPLARKWLADTWWHHLKAKIPVVKDFRYLGPHVNIAGGRKAATLDARLDKGLGHLAGIGRLGADAKEKGTTVGANVQAGTFYGIEESDMTDRQATAFSAATIDVFKKRNNRLDVEWFYSTCSQ